MRPNDLAFQLPARNGVRPLERIADAFHGRRHPAEVESWRWLDTFDWRVERGGARLELHVGAGGGELVLLDPEALPGRAPLADAPAFARDLPPGTLRERLGQLTGPRRILVQAEVERRRESVDVLDETGKIVCRVHRIDDRLRPPGGAWSEAPPVVLLEGLRGYDGEREVVREFLRSRLGLTSLPEERDGLRRALGARAGVDPCTVAVVLEADSPAHLAVRAVLADLLRVLSLNVDGIARDLDPEFLHDFRVALRRTRVVLSEMKRVLPEAVETHFKREFAWLGAASGPPRDLDVLLLELEESPPDLAPLLELLTEKRRLAREALTAELAGQRYAHLVQAWTAVLAEKKPPRTPRRNARVPIASLAARRVRRRLKRLVRAAAQLAPHSPAEEIHALRIQAKRLRYLLDLFGSLFPAEPCRSLLRELKRLQDGLGELHDAHVHVRELEAAAEELAARGTGARSLLAIGRRIAEFERREQRERERLPERLATFADAAREVELPAPQDGEGGAGGAR